jgi:hypothetical protein
MKLNVQATGFKHATQCATGHDAARPPPGANVPCPLEGKPAILITGPWLKRSEDGSTAYPAPHHHAKKSRWHRKKNPRPRKKGFAHQEGIASKLDAIEKRLVALETKE